MNNSIDNKNIILIKSRLREAASTYTGNPARFFKTGSGHYAETDEFIGISAPSLRKIAKEFKHLSFEELQGLVKSKINEERLLALLILTYQYTKASSSSQEEIYQFYLDNLQYVNNWNLVDASAHLIVGAHLIDKDKSILLKLAQSDIMWERRIAIVATWYFIRQNDLSWTFKIAEILLVDKHDLIHKAVGWMLREAGKRNQDQLIGFLDRYTPSMPRTMLRYAIEKFSEQERKHYLMRK